MMRFEPVPGQPEVPGQLPPPTPVQAVPPLRPERLIAAPSASEPPPETEPVRTGPVLAFVVRASFGDSGRAMDPAAPPAGEQPVPGPYPDVESADAQPEPLPSFRVEQVHQ